MTPEQSEYVSKISDEVHELQQLIWRFQIRMSTEKGDTARIAATILNQAYGLVGVIGHKMLCQIAQDNTGESNA